MPSDTSKSISFLSPQAARYRSLYRGQPHKESAADERLKGLMVEDVVEFLNKLVHFECLDFNNSRFLILNHSVCFATR